MRAFIIAVPIAAALAGCATSSERAAQAQREVEQMVEIYGPACTKLGFTVDTDPWRSCIINLGRKDDAYYPHHALYGYYGPPHWRGRYWGYW